MGNTENRKLKRIAGASAEFEISCQEDEIRWGQDERGRGRGGGGQEGFPSQVKLLRLMGDGVGGVDKKRGIQRSKGGSIVLLWKGKSLLLYLSERRSSPPSKRLITR